MLLPWDLTVPSATKRSLAISALVLPEATKLSTSSSRSLSGSSRRTGEVLEHPRRLVHGQRGPHRGGGRELGLFRQGAQELSLLGLLVFQTRGTAHAAAQEK